MLVYKTAANGVEKMSGEVWDAVCEAQGCKDVAGVAVW